MTKEFDVRSVAKRASVLVAAMVAVLGLGPVLRAEAAPLDPVDVTFPAGLVCEFALRVQGSGGGNQVEQEFPGRDGESITVSAGRGYDLVFTNVSNGKQLSLPSRFASTKTYTHADGTKTVVLSGWNVVFLFPSDDPVGPSTTLHVGVVVYEDDGNSNFTIDQRRTHSRTTDICAAVT